LRQGEIKISNRALKPSFRFSRQARGSNGAEPVGQLPNFLIIGAMKGGTTSLYHYVGAHPQVYVPPFKAPEFFAGEPRPRRGLDWYCRQFAGAGPGAVAVGEASNVYTKYPRYPGVPQRIAEHIPHVRLVYAVRDPIQRIRSHYQTKVAEGTEPAPFEVAVFDNPIYVDYSRYSLQIEQYMSCFPREQLLVITSEDLRSARMETVQKVYEFLGVDADFVPDELDRDFYLTADRASRSPLPVWMKKGLKKHVPSTKRFKELESNVVRNLNRVRRRPASGPAPPKSFVISDETRAKLVALLQDDVRRLRNYLGSDFDGWGIG
jgi:hypothetical protein